MRNLFIFQIHFWWYRAAFLLPVCAADNETTSWYFVDRETLVHSVLPSSGSLYARQVRGNHAVLTFDDKRI